MKHSSRLVDILDGAVRGCFCLGNRYRPTQLALCTMPSKFLWEVQPFTPVEMCDDNMIANIPE